MVIAAPQALVHQPTGTPARAGIAAATRWRLLASNLALALLFAYFGAALLVNWRATGRVQLPLAGLTELLIVGLVLTRRQSVAESRSVRDWALALIGTAAPLLVRPGLALEALAPIGIALQLVGGALAVAAVVSLGRSFGIVAANRGVRTGGFYRFVRHPLFGAYLVVQVGFLLGNLSLLNAAALALAWACQYLRAVAEERVLRQDPAYREYASRVRARFIPHVL